MLVSAYTLKDAWENMKVIMEDVSDYNETVIITRPKNRNVVMISKAEYNASQETLHLFGTAGNREAIDKSLKQLRYLND